MTNINPIRVYQLKKVMTLTRNNTSDATKGDYYYEEIYEYVEVGRYDQSGRYNEIPVTPTYP